MDARQFYNLKMPAHLKPKDTYDKLNKQFDYYDLIGFAEEYLEHYKSRQE